MKLKHLIVVTVGIIFVVMLLTSFAFYHGYRTFYLHNLAERLSAIVHQTEELVRIQMSCHGISGIQRQLDGVVAARSILDYIAYADENGTIRYATNRQMIGAHEPAGAVPFNSGLVRQLEEGKRLFVSAIPKRGGRFLIAIDEENTFHRLERNALRLASQVMAALLLFSSLVGVVVYLGLISPLRHVTEIARRRHDDGRSLFLQEFADLKEELLESYAQERMQTLRLRTLLDAIPDLVWFKDHEGRYLFCNPAFERFFGASEKEIIGKTDHDFVDHELADFFRQKDLEAMAKGAPSINSEWVTFASTGKRVLLETIKTPIYHEDREVMGVLGIARDMTTHFEMQERLREQEELYWLVIEEATDGIVMVNTETGRIEHFNRAAYEGLGYTKEEFAQLSLADFHLPSYFECCGILPGEKVGHDSHIHLTKDGRQQEVVVSILMINVANKHYRVHIWHDVTEERNYQRRLEAKVAEETARRLEGERLLMQQSKMAAMAEMLTGIAHNWRQPLNVLALIIQDIQEAYDAGELDQDYINRTINQAMAQIDKMTHMIDDLSGFTATKEEPDWFEIEPLVQSVFDLFASDFDRLGVVRTIEIAPELRGKIKGLRHALKQVLYQLVANARDAIAEAEAKGEKFAPLLKLSATQNEGWLYLCLFNNGPLIPDAIMERLFDPYFTTKEQGKGVGLGLYLSRRAVREKMGGELRAHNLADGVEFCIELPLLETQGVS